MIVYTSTYTGGVHGRLPSAQEQLLHASEEKTPALPHSPLVPEQCHVFMPLAFPSVPVLRLLLCVSLAAGWWSLGYQ